MTAETGYRMRSVGRRSRRTRHCVNGHPIGPGDRYVEHTLFPGHDLLDVRVPSRFAECADCACDYGRAHLLPQTQPEPKAPR